MNQTCRTFTLLGLLSVSVLAWAQELPSGWRPALPSEVGDEARQDSPTRYTRAEGDFNGDGISDVAYVLKSTRFSGEALWVWLSEPGGGHRWIRLEQIRWPKNYSSVGLAMAVAIQEPGVVTYACFDSAKECDFRPPGGRPKLKLQDASLIYFKPESAASLYFWSNKHSRFLRVWLSD
jgi:hypothetical protein